MLHKLPYTALFTLALSFTAAAADKPRIFLTESGAAQLSGGTTIGDTKGTLSFSGGTSPQSVEAMKHFTRSCPDVVITANREKANYIVRLDSEFINPTTPFVRANKVAVFNTNEDLVYSNSTRMLGSAVKDACAAIVKDAKAPVKN